MSKTKIITFIVDKSGKTKSFNDLNHEERCKLDKIIKDSIISHKNISSFEIKND